SWRSTARRRSLGRSSGSCRRASRSDRSMASATGNLLEESRELGTGYIVLQRTHIDPVGDVLSDQAGIRDRRIHTSTRDRREPVVDQIAPRRGPQDESLRVELRNLSAPPHLLQGAFHLFTHRACRGDRLVRQIRERVPIALSRGSELNGQEPKRATERRLQLIENVHDVSPRLGEGRLYFQVVVTQ